jgi:sulfotransferase family protein
MTGTYPAPILTTSEPTTTPGPVFVGGVPRSGTHALANLLARHSRYAMVPRELGFHTGVGGIGLPDLLGDRITLSEFLEVMSSHWWKRTTPWDSTVTRGLYKTIPEDRFQRCLEHFARTYPSDAFGAARTFMHGMLDPIADDDGKPAWVEMDPYNIFVAPVLYRIFPDMRLIHIMRDGRDVALSLGDLPWGRGGTLSGIWRWQRILRKGHGKLRELPEDRVLTIQLEDLVATRREDTYARILEFLQLQDERSMHAFFDEKISARNAHVGRWREVSSVRRLTTTAVYGCALARLAMSRVAPRPRLRGPEHPPRVTDFTRRAQQETIDPWADGTAKDA